MRILDWYLGRTILTTTFVSLFILTCISGMFRFIEQLKSVGKGNYDMVHAALFSLYSVPTDIEIFFPMAALVGGLAGLGMLANSSELIVMQAAGLSRFNIIISVMKTALLMMVMVMLLGEFGAPAATQKAREIRAQAISGGSLISGSQGVWAKDGEYFVNIGEVKDTGNLKQISIYQFDESLTLQGIVKADTAVFADGQWHLENVVEQSISPDEIITTQKGVESWQSTLTPDKLGVVTVKPESLPISGLSEYLDYLLSNKQDTSRYELALWRKIFQPLTIAVMLLMALSFIFGPLRSVTMGARILLGIITGFAFYMSSQIFGPFSQVYQLPPILGALLPSILFAGIAFILLKRRA